MIYLLLNYIKMLKSGFYLKSFLYLLLLIIPSLIKSLWIVDIGYYEIPYVIIVGFIIIFLGINEISEKRFMLCMTIPIKTRDIIKIAYVNTYIIFILGFCCTFFISICSSQKLPTLYLLFIAVFPLITNALYPTITYSELKIKMSDQTDIVVWTFLAVIGMTFIIFLVIAINTYLHQGVSTIVIISLIAGFTVKKSYIATLKKVMK